MKDFHKKVVKTLYPKAFARRWPGPEVIIYTPLQRGMAIIGRGKTAAQAWKDAVNFGPDTSKR